MTTHGCLLVTDYLGRRVMLHTHHTGQDIPSLPAVALDLLVDHYRGVVPRDRGHALVLIDAVLITERLHCANSAASLLIAARPCYLEIVTRGSRADLPQWSGIDRPYKLKIMKDGRWVLLMQDGSLSLELDTTEEVVARMLARSVSS